MKVKIVLKVFGRLVTVFGLMFSLMNQLGWLQDKNRNDLLQAVLKADRSEGVSFAHPAAGNFQKRFPSPHSGEQGEIIAITKHGLVISGNVAQATPFCYALSNGEITDPVASLEEAKAWASESPYGLIAWFVTLLGFLIVLITDYVEWKSVPGTEGTG